VIRQLLLGRLGAGDSPMLIGGTTFILLEGLLRASGVLILCLTSPKKRPSLPHESPSSQLHHAHLALARWELV